MNYEKKYKEALERMKSWAKGEHPECFSEAQKTAEFIFPELKESENERIRKAIHIYLDWLDGRKDYEPKGDYSIKDMIAWLEKQGKEEYTLKSFRDKDVHKFMQYIEKQAKAYEFNLPNRSYDIYAFAKDILIWLEKQGEKMTKPKFNVGDWITDGCLTCKVLGVTGKSYELHLHNDDYCHFETDIQSVDKYYHLWTIQDAKDGDVLVHNDCPFIFMGIKDNLVQALEENLCDSTNPVNFGEPNIDNDYQPATREQRKLLFQKIKEAGYEWDSEKKELKKIELASKESKDERIRKGLIKTISSLLDNTILYHTNITKEEALAWLEKQTNKD